MVEHAEDSLAIVDGERHHVLAVRECCEQETCRRVRPLARQHPREVEDVLTAHADTGEAQHHPKVTSDRGACRGSPDVKSVHADW